jgi:hypothetical protein
MIQGTVGRRVSAIVMLVCACVAGSLPVTAEQPRPAAAAAQGDELLEAKAFHDPQSGIDLRLPKGWVAKQGIKSTGFEAPAKDRVAAGGLAPSVILGRDPAPGVKPSDIDAVIKGKRAQYAKLFKGYREEAAGPVPEIAGKGVGRIDCSHVVSGVLRIRTGQVWVLGDGVAYTITFTSLGETYADHEKAFDAVLKSISIP